MNPVTREKEPYLPTWSRTVRFFATGSAVFFMVSLKFKDVESNEFFSSSFLQLIVVLCAVLGTIIYRLSLVSIIYGSGDGLLNRHAKIFTSISAALINLVIIMCLTRVSHSKTSQLNILMQKQSLFQFYHKIAIQLTNLENPRTQTEYEDSYTFKIFVFEFMNFYSSLIYIAFFKVTFQQSEIFPSQN